MEPSNIIEALDVRLAESGITFANSVDRNANEARERVPPFFYDGRSYFYEDDSGLYHTMDSKSLNLRLIRDGYYDMDEYGRRHTSRYVLAVQDHHPVNYAGSVAGYTAGIHPIGNGPKMLVTQSVLAVSPAPGNWPTLHTLLENMLGDEQLVFFHAWNKIFFESYRESIAKGSSATPIPGQAVAFAGSRDGGKTLLARLLTEMYGGRSACPHQFFTGGTTFNADLVEAPILVIDDQAASRDPRDRNHLGASLKEFTVAGSIRIHAKYQNAVTLRPVQRVLILCNDDAAALMVLPSLDPSLEDKLMLFKVESKPMPMPTGTISERALFWKTLIDELPAYAHWLLNLEIPEELKSPRFGVKHFHHPDIVEAIKELAPETRVLEMIDELMTKDLFCAFRGVEAAKRDDCGLNDPRTEPWYGTASEFEGIISTRFGRRETDKFFKYTNSGGMLLRELSRKHPDRVVRDTTIRGTQRWFINPPDYAPEVVSLPSTEKSNVALTDLLSKIPPEDEWDEA